MDRRDLFKLTLGGAAAIALGTTDAVAAKGTKTSSDKMLGRHQVVVLGGGWGGLTVAKELKKIDSNFDVLIVEQNNNFISCPLSNTKLGGLKGINMEFLTHDYGKTIEKYKYGMLHAVVIGIDRASKVVTTSKGKVGYDILVLAPGIEYNYKGQFPNWSDAKISQAKRVATGGLLPQEHVALDRIIKGVKGNGDIIVTVPAGKYRCPPAPFERASMIANHMKTKGLKGKVIILNETDAIAKGAAFKESWKEINNGQIDYRDNCKILDVDFDKKTITYEQKVFANKEDLEGTKTVHTIPYGALNLIPHNKSNSIVTMSGVETTADGYKKVKMATSEAKPVSFQTKSDISVYAVGDVVGHGIPPSGQAAIWSGKECAKEIAHVLHGKSYSVASVLPYKSANVCYSMVNGNPEEAIMVNHEFVVDNGTIFGKPSVPKGDTVNNKFRSQMLGKATREWYKGAMRDLFN
jgi:NADPH-dependent 2,4-dienoyl-CoA reductase/sulfur reductase-like enzyme